jgi:hypothetical protein
VRSTAPGAETVHAPERCSRKPCASPLGRCRFLILPSAAGSIAPLSDDPEFVAHRQKQGITNKKGERIANVSNAEINRELPILKRTFSLAIDDGLIAMRQKIKMLDENNVRKRFFEHEQFEAVKRHLPDELKDVITFAYVTG